MIKNNPRYIIFEILYKFFTTKISLKIIIKKYSLKSEDAPFIMNALRGILREKKILEENIYLYSKTKKINLKDMILLYLGIYQLLYCNSVPAYAAINTTVDIAKSINKRSSGFINAILRKINQQSYKKQKTDPPDIYYGYPKWLINELISTYNDRAYSICDANATQSPIWIRINRFKSNLDEILNILSKNKISFYKDDLLLNYLKLNRFDKKGIILNLAEKGKIYIQNPSSEFIVRLLNPSKEDIILDACSAPGGKAFSILEKTKNNINLTCMDIKEDRINKMKKNFNTLGIKNITFSCNDASLMKNDKKYNKILLDLPCTSSGTIRKNPDVKWRINKQNIMKLKNKQYDILNNMKNNLTDKGEIVYSTCSILPEENHKNVVKFLKENPNFYIPKINENIPDILKNNLGGISILPDINDYEGMFAIKLKKNA